MNTVGTITADKPRRWHFYKDASPAPRLAGLSYEYLAATMRDFATEERGNNGDMPKFMQALTDRERDAMAHYICPRFEERPGGTGQSSTTGGFLGDRRFAESLLGAALLVLARWPLMIWWHVSNGVPLIPAAFETLL